MKFINRKNEMKTLEKEFTRDSSFTVIYGRRRTGKTTLIKEFIKTKESFYFFADKQNEIIQIERFKKQLAIYFNDDLLDKIEIKDWDTLFTYLISKLSKNEKFVLVIDEFQYLCMTNKNFSSIFQRIYDEKLKDSNVMLILCGSLISMMYSEVLAYDSPLYGRRTAQIRLKPIKFDYYNEFFTDKSHKELIEFYSITGGIPKYIQEFNKNRSPIWNIENNIFDNNNFLYSEPKFLLQEEINDLSRYFSIIQSIANGDTKMAAIATRLGLNSGSLSPYLSKLIDLDILEREVPVTENIDNSKKSLYYIKDNYLAFWFNYVYPYQSYLEIENLKYPLEKISSTFDLWVSKAYERLCLESLITHEEIDFPISKVGRWWSKNEEIDVVGLGENEIIFGECKWSKKHVGLSVLFALKEKAKKVKWKNNSREEYFILFSKSGFSPDLIEAAEKDLRIILSEF
ncbi:ATP-binding protein [Psychrilyobacter atlanticus]|uniref:ATP-binding protein n=1 Tax=Psychrilyobacter atlanticus TaxID=271091 RepID=UPI0003F69134|nr:ATP-binding protein [Psychrilyobacter atlanticus]